MKLHLGFEDRAYPSQPSPLKRGKSTRPLKATYGQGKTSREVAKELEDRYKIVEEFWNLEQDIFTESLEEAFAEDLEEIMTMEQPSSKGVSYKGTDAIEARFRRDLRSRRYDNVISGVPTLAAKRGSRPSFIITGTYLQSFRAWVEEEYDE
jgi:hypothetical protein